MVAVGARGRGAAKQRLLLCALPSVLDNNRVAAFSPPLVSPQLPNRIQRQSLDRLDFDVTMIDDDDLLHSWQKKLNNTKVQSVKGRRVLQMFGVDRLRDIVSFTVNYVERGQLRRKSLLFIVLVTPCLAFCRVCHVRLRLSEPLKLDAIWQHLENGSHSGVSVPRWRLHRGWRTEWW